MDEFVRKYKNNLNRLLNREFHILKTKFKEPTFNSKLYYVTQMRLSFICVWKGLYLHYTYTYTHIYISSHMLFF